MAELTAEHVRIIVREELAGTQTDVGGLKSDVSELKSDVGELKVDVGELKSDVSELKVDVGELKIEVRDLGIKFEHFDAKMDTIAELVTTTVGTRREVAELGPRVEALEGQSAVQKHVIQEHSLALRQLRGEA